MTDKPATTSHAEALKSTSIMGGSTMLVMLVRMVRTKVLAGMLGPAGIGLEGIFDSIINLAKSLVDFGISSSGVRQIAASVGTGNQRLITVTVMTLRRTCLILGIVGATTLFLLRETVSRAAFGSADHARDVGLLSVILLLGAVTGGQGALLQGMRRIRDLAKMNVYGAIAGAGLSIPFVYLWGQNGIVPYMVVAACVGGIVSWSYARRVPIERTTVSVRDITREATSLLKLGGAFLSTSLMSTGALFLLRAFVTRHEGLIGTGQFQAASALSTVYVGFILQAMGTDFYPRLTVVAHDNARCNQLVNEQAEISILLALPGVLATLAAAPWVIRIFYSDKFSQAPEILCWQVTGMFLQVNSWPMGFIVVAKGRAAIMFWVDFIAYAIYVGLAWLGLKWFGLPGTGMAYLGLYVFHWVFIYLIVRRVSGFRLSRENLKLTILGGVTVAFAFLSRLVLPEPWSTSVGGVLALVLGLYSFKALIRLVGTEKVNSFVQKLKQKFGVS